MRPLLVVTIVLVLLAGSVTAADGPAIVDVAPTVDTTPVVVQPTVNIQPERPRVRWRELFRFRRLCCR